MFVRPGLIIQSRVGRLQLDASPRLGLSRYLPVGRDADYRLVHIHPNGFGWM